MSDDEVAEGRGRGRDRFQRERDIDHSSRRDAFGRDLDRRDNFGRDRRDDRDRSPPGKRRRSVGEDAGFHQPIFPGGPPPMHMHGPGGGFMPMPPPMGFPGQFNGPAPSRVMSVEALLKNDTLLSFKQFLETQDPDVDPDKASTAYAHYKQELTVRQLQKFFATHRLADWFQEKYNPTRKAERQQLVNKRAADEAAAFLAEWRDGQFDALSYDSKAAAPQAAAASTAVDSDAAPVTANTNSTTTAAPAEIPADPAGMDADDDEFGVDSKAGDEGSSAASVQASQNIAKMLVLKTVPPTFTRAQLETLCKRVDGFLFLELSEVNPMKKFHRVGWAFYGPEVDIAAAFQQLDHSRIDTFEFHFSVYNCNLLRSQRLPSGSGSPDRKAKDLALALKLVEHLDREKSIAPSFAAAFATDNLTAEQTSLRLDQLILYMRRVHLFDYYSANEAESMLALQHRSGAQPERAPFDGTTNDEWEHRLDDKIAKRLASTVSGVDLQKLKPKDVDAEVQAGLEVHVARVEEGKYRCSICSKLFKGPEFVIKHLMLKHEENAKLLHEEAEMYNAYVQDANRVMPLILAAPSLGAPGFGAHNKQPIFLLPPRPIPPPAAFFPYHGHPGEFMGPPPHLWDDGDGRGAYDRRGGPMRGRSEGFHPYGRGGPTTGRGRDRDRTDRDRRDRSRSRSRSRERDRGRDREYRDNGPRVIRPPPMRDNVDNAGRTVRSYRDLDAPPADEIMDYRSAGL